MSFLDRIGNKVDNMRSKQNENSDVSSINKQISFEKDAIDVAITRIGEYYWNAYAKGEIEAPAEIAEEFVDVENRVRLIEDLNGRIEARRAAGIEQRIQIDIATKEREDKKAAEAAERRRQREEARRLAAEEKAAEEMTSDSKEP